MAGERAHRHNTVMEAELRYVMSPDLADMVAMRPADASDFCMLVQAIVGPRGGPGEESFDFIVCTPKWLGHQLLSRPYLFARHYLVIDHYDYNVILDAIASKIRSVSGSSWNEVAERLSRYGQWEFEDYRPAEERSET